MREIILMMEAVSSSEMLVGVYQTTQCNVPEDSHVKGLKSLTFLTVQGS
jgi:hypothetical protein